MRFLLLWVELVLMVALLIWKIFSELIGLVGLLVSGRNWVLLDCGRQWRGCGCKDGMWGLTRCWVHDGCLFVDCNPYYTQILAGSLRVVEVLVVFFYTLFCRGALVSSGLLMTFFVYGAKLAGEVGPLAWGGSFLLGYVWGSAFGRALFVAPSCWPARI